MYFVLVSNFVSDILNVNFLKSLLNVIDLWTIFVPCNLTVLFSPTLSMLSDESKHVFLALIRYAANYGILSQHRGGGGGTAIYGLLIGRWGCEGYGIQAVYTGIGYINKEVWV